MFSYHMWMHHVKVNAMACDINDVKGIDLLFLNLSACKEHSTALAVFWSLTCGNYELSLYISKVLLNI